MTRLYAYAAAALLGLSAIASAYAVGYYRATAKAEREAAVDAWRVYTDAVKLAAAVYRDVATIAEDLRIALADSQQREATTVTATRQVLHENPDFAAARRPVDLDRLRREQLEAIQRAAQADQLQH